MGRSIRRDDTVRRYCLLASLGWIWSSGSTWAGAIASIIGGLLRVGHIRNAIAQDHTTKMSLKTVVNGHWLWCVRRITDMGLFRGKVDLRRRW